MIRQLPPWLRALLTKALEIVRAPRSRWAIAGLVVVGLAVVAAIALTTHSALALRRFERAEARRATFVHAAGQLLAPGISVRAIDLGATLGRLRYVETRGAPGAPGQHRRTAAQWDIAPRGGGVDGATGRLRLDLRGDRITKVTLDNEPVSDVRLEGEVLTSAGDRVGEDYRPVQLGDVPPVAMRAILAAEDHRFFDHRGVDLVGLARAAWVNMRSGRVAQGGSTITQQLVKNRLLTPRRTVMRKLEEAWLATLIEWRYPKKRILEAYLNEIYLGQRGPLAIRGFGAAARSYFGKEIHQLDLGEAALLAGMARAPNTYSPAVNPERSRERRDVVLARMRELGWIDDDDLRVARAARVGVRGTPGGGQSAPYFTDHVRQEIEQLFDDDSLDRARGARIHTTLDLPLQRFAETALTRGLDRLETRHRALRRPAAGARLQGALIALDPATGRITALVGGRDYGTSQFNRATLARRQPGSAFKPFVYAAALAAPHGAPKLTAASIVEDTPVTLRVGDEDWSPRNYEDRYEGFVTVRRALEHSLNAATVRVGEAVGFKTVVDAARALGVHSRLSAVPAMVLGSFEVTPLELARAYVPFANGGVRPGGPTTLALVEDGDGSPVTIEEDARDRVLSVPEAYLMTSLLGGVVQSGTAAAARGLAAPGTLAGKTGTTNDGRDAWFIGYSPSLIAVVWVGFDDNEPHRLSGSDAALPIWIDFMRQALDAYPEKPFTPPPGIAFAEIDPTNGRVANRSCPLIVRETFLAGTEPPPCTEHGGVSEQFIDWWRRFRDWFKR
ncbi:MAG: PBP1A family penicillin-binding protein [Candidatus Rokubacteria bacterium]|nr:PBP1A family penicillin-binding protein [Candidatus Rokubacteria bacterium]